MTNIVLIIALFFIHWLGDFTAFATAKMHKSKAIGAPIGPIFLHACVHAGFVAVLLFIFQFNGNLILQLTLFQLVSHFLIDVTKGKLSAGFQMFRDNTTYPYWMLFGFDQFLHGVVMILIWAIATGAI